MLCRSVAVCKALEQSQNSLVLVPKGSVFEAAGFFSCCKNARLQVSEIGLLLPCLDFEFNNNLYHKPSTVKARSHFKAVVPDNFGIPLAAVFHYAVLVFIVDIDQSKALVIA